jgi:hypothetical protein
MERRALQEKRIISTNNKNIAKTKQVVQKRIPVLLVMILHRNPVTTIVTKAKDAVSHSARRIMLFSFRVDKHANPRFA